MSLENCEDSVPTVILGEDKNVSVKLTSKNPNGSLGDPFDLSAASEITAVLMNADGSYLTKALSTNGILMVSAVGGHFQIALAASETLLLAPSVLGKYSNIKLTITIAGKKTIIPLINSINIIAPPFPGA